MRPEFRNNLQALMQQYIECLEDDISMPEALATVFTMTTWINAEIDKDLVSRAEIESVIDFIRSIDQVL